MRHYSSDLLRTLAVRSGDEATRAAARAELARRERTPVGARPIPDGAERRAESPRQPGRDWWRLAEDCAAVAFVLLTLTAVGLYLAQWAGWL